MTALIISGGGMLIMGGYAALYNNFNSQLNQNTNDITQVKAEYSGLAQKATDIDQNVKDIKAYIMAKR